MTGSELKIANKNVELLALKIARESPELNDLNPEQLEAIAKIVITQRLTKEMNDKASVAGIDFEVEKSVFLKQAGKSKSKHTRIAYNEALVELENHVKKFGINIFLMTYAQADDFIYSLDGSPNSKRLTIAAISSFFSFLERRYSTIKNPIRGTKARPVSRTVKDVEVPDDVELSTILNSIPEIERVAVYIMAYRGLRVGALNKLKVWGNNYRAVSKGKSISGEFPPDVICNLKSSILNANNPFHGVFHQCLKAESIQGNFETLQ